jgi:hypothetical protein
VATAVNLSNVTFDGYQSWTPLATSNGYGFYWNDTTSNAVSQNLTIKNVRQEQTVDSTVYIIYINHHTNLHGLFLENIYGGLNVKGYYFRKCFNVTIKDSQYFSTSLEALNVDSTVYNLTLINDFWQSGSTATLTGQYWGYCGPLPNTGIYTNTNDVNGNLAAYSQNFYPIANNTYYLGRNSNSSPLAWKGVILKDTTNSHYYRIEIINGVITPTDLGM